MVLKFKLFDDDALDDAIEKLNAYKEKVDGLEEKVTKIACDKGVEYAKQNVADMGAIDTGALESSIHADVKGNTGKVIADAPHAAFVEFGTGVVGAGSSHPNPALAGWKYDVNEHGEKGWWYPGDDGKLHWTKGMPSRPFMYSAGVQVEDRVYDIAKEAMQ